MADPKKQSSLEQKPSSLERCVTICNSLGLHARAAAKFVATVGRYDADVWVCRGGHQVSGKSIMGLMMLAASMGTQIRIAARGRQADQVMDALEALIKDRFGERQDHGR